MQPTTKKEKTNNIDTQDRSSQQSETSQAAQPPRWFDLSWVLVFLFLRFYL